MVHLYESIEKCLGLGRHSLWPHQALVALPQAHKRPLLYMWEAKRSRWGAELSGFLALFHFC